MIICNSGKRLGRGPAYRPRSLGTTALGLALVAAGATGAFANTLQEETGATQSEVNAEIDNQTSNSAVANLAKDIAAVALQSDPDAKTFTGTVQGVELTITSSELTARQIATTNDATFDINGQTSQITTSASGFDQIRDDDTITIVVEGETLFSGTVSSAGSDDVLRIFNTFGVVEANQSIQTETSRSTTSVQQRIISARISSVIRRSGLARSFDRDADVSASEKVGALDYSFHDGIYGISGGNGISRTSVWGSFAYDFIDGEQSDVGSNYDGHLITGLLGADVVVNDQFVVGATLVIDHLDIDTPFNNGTVETTGIGITPYVGGAFLDGRLLADAQVGYSWLGTDTERNRTTTQIDGGYGGNRITAAGNVSYDFSVTDQILVSPGTGVRFAYEFGETNFDSAGVQQTFVESYVGDWLLGGRAAYFHDLSNEGFGAIEVFTSQFFVYDVVPWFSDNAFAGTRDRTALESTFGVDWLVNDQAVVSAEVTNVFLRKGSDDTSLVASVRYSF